MNIGIVVYSQTGNTYRVAQELKEKLAASGHEASIERVTLAGDATPGAKNIQFENLPPVEPYDALIFGSPVQAFSLAAPMKAYLEQLSTLQGKRVACFVTKQLPFYWTGGNQALSRMKQICEAKEGKVCGSAVVVWSKTKLEQNIRACLESVGALF